MAYTVSLYHVAQGSRKDQPTIPLNISFAVVLQDEHPKIEGSDLLEDELDKNLGDDDEAREEEEEGQTDLQAGF